MTDLARLTTTEAAAALAKAHIAILPVGAIEQHGPHLELRTDIAIAEAFARRLDKDLGEASLLCPPLPYGLSEHHLAFPGTLTLRPETFMSVLEEITESLAHHGIQKVIVMNGHGGNMDAVRLAARRARRDRGQLVAHMMWARLCDDVIAEEMAGRSLFNHACEIETSLALVLDPDLVHADALGEPGWRAQGNELNDPPVGRVDLPVWFHEWTADGALGDPRSASVELGERILARGYDRALAFARHFVDRPLPSSSQGDHAEGSARSSSPMR